MTRWQYAWLKDEPQLAVFFSHPQGPALIPEFSAILGSMLFVQQSTEWVLAWTRPRSTCPTLPASSAIAAGSSWQSRPAFSRAR